MAQIFIWKKHTMTERAWMVRAQSFSRPNYEIHGVNLRDAVERGVPLMLKDVLPRAKPEDVLHVEMTWCKDVLNGQGGAEIVLTVDLGEGQATSFLAHVASTREETPACEVWQRTGGRLRLLKYA